jgi:hypothetical protein
VLGISVKSNRFLPLFILHSQPDTRKAANDGKRHFTLQRRNGIATFFQMVIGDSGSQMVDMMITDVAGKPSQHSR